MIKVSKSQEQISNPGYNVSQNGNPAQAFTVLEPAFDQVAPLLFQPPTPTTPIGRGSFLLFGLPFNVRSVMGKLVFSNDPSIEGIWHQPAYPPSGWLATWIGSQYTTVTQTWTWRIFI